MFCLSLRHCANRRGCIRSPETTSRHLHSPLLSAKNKIAEETKAHRCITVTRDKCNNRLLSCTVRRGGSSRSAKIWIEWKEQTQVCGSEVIAGSSRNFKRLLVPDCPDNELLPSSHIMSGGREFTQKDAVSTVCPLAAGVSRPAGNKGSVSVIVWSPSHQQAGQ